MTQLFHGSVSGASHPIRAGASVAAWRQVPRINLLPKRQSFLKPIVVVLLVVILVQAFFLLYLYLGMLEASDQVETATIALDGASAETYVEENTLADMELEIESIDQETAQLVGEHEQLILTYQGLTEGWTDWAASLEAVLVVDDPDVRLDKIVTRPGGEMTVVWTATGAHAISGFDDHIRSVESLLELGSMQCEGLEPPLACTAEIMVR